ncbi:hypothetical protein CASFOL_024784 [Castilleja foliolosa]|uniref:Transcriptional adapter 1 n=1 Tax=Castilleja foliolosa TaxID=1961234 RepID=A0ABD3CPB2_9LAMI
MEQNNPNLVYVYVSLLWYCVLVIVMKPPHQYPRINLDELKAQIVKKLGPEGSKQYFYYLHRFLSLKLCKTEFNKLCLKILGRENIPLHNQFIRSILKNACSPKASPATNHYKDDEILKQATHHKDDENSADGGYQQNGSHISTTQVSSGLLPVSPRKSRTVLRNRRGSGGRRSVLGPNGKTVGFTQPSDFNIVLENGDLIKSNPNPDNMQHHQALIQPTESEDVGPTSTDISSRSPIRAPLGIPFCPARRALPPMGTLIGTFCDALLDNCALRERMEHIAVGQGLGGVSMDCANVLNHGLDSYLKGLIKSCIDISGARLRSAENEHHAHPKPINGVKFGYQHHLQNSGLQLDEQKINGSISLHDFRVAMELNPQQLGEDWPLLLEKICMRAFEE